METVRGKFRISTDRDDVDIDAVHAFLAHSYWAEGISRDLVEKSVRGSIPFSLLHGTDQAGFARVITDEATYAYLADVFILEKFRGKGLGHWLIETVLSDPRVKGVRRFALFTRDAHQLYAPFGFRNAAHPERYMEITHPGMYKSGRSEAEK